MKKRLICLAAAAGIAAGLGGAALASSGGQPDSLVSQSYLEGTFLRQITQSIADWAQQGFALVYDQALDHLDQTLQYHLGGVPIPEGWESGDSFTHCIGQGGDTLTLAQGSGIVWIAGSGSADGVLVDVTQGIETQAGSPLQANHRYLAPDQVTITASEPSSWAVEGIWTITGSASQLPFVDVPTGSWYHSSIVYVYENGLFQGSSQTLFSPSGEMERGMITTVLHRLAGSPPVGYTPIFQDIPQGMWYTEGTVWAGETGIVSGLGQGIFGPEDPVSRQQIATILFHYAQHIQKDTAARADLSDYSDADSVAGWAQDGVSWAVALGILRGSDGQISPDHSATRAEVAAMLQRFDAWLG